MTSATVEPWQSRLRLDRARIARLLRSPALKALVGANLIVVGIILARGHGWLQPFELLIYDALRVSWAGHEPSSRILLAGGNEDDITNFDWPLRDGELADLLERIASWKPRVIGVDIYRDKPKPPGTERLAAVLARHKEIVWAFKLEEGEKPAIQPPEVLRGTDRAVLADFIPDAGNVVRRALLYAGDQNYTAMGMEMGLRYLAAEQIKPAAASGDDIRLGKALLSPLDEKRGPYTRLDSSGYQVLLDYHGGPNPFPLKTIGDIMRSDEAAPLVAGRAVIVGVMSESVKDSFSSPFNTGFNSEDQMNGIVVNAHIADQLIRQARDGTAILHGFSRGIEGLWIWAWAMAGVALGLLVRNTVAAICASAAGLLGLAGFVYAASGAAVLLPALPGLTPSRLSS